MPFQKQHRTVCSRIRPVEKTEEDDEPPSDTEPETDEPPSSIACKRPCPRRSALNILFGQNRSFGITERELSIFVPSPYDNSLLKSSFYKFIKNIKNLKRSARASRQRLELFKNKTIPTGMQHGCPGIRLHIRLSN